MKNVISTVCVSISFLTAAPYTSEQLQGQLDSLNFLQQEAIRNGEDKDNELSVAIKHLQTAIETQRKSEEISINGGNKEKISQKNESDWNFFSEFNEIFVQQSLIDKLMIIMGLVAILAGIFLILARIFLAVSRKNKTKRVLFDTKKEILPKTANVLNEINRYRERVENFENATYSIKEIAKKNPANESFAVSSEEPKKMRAIEIKNEIVKRFDNGEDTAKIAQDFSMSKDQVVMILNLAGRK